MLTAEIEPYRQWLLEQGFTPATVRLLLRILSLLGVGLQERGQAGTAIDRRCLEELFATRRALGRRGVPGRLGISRLLAFLDERGLLARVPSGQSTALEQLLDEFRGWLVQERNLSAGTVLRHENASRRFLAEQAVHDGVLKVSDLTGVDVNAFLLRECARVSAGSAKGRVAELRSLLRFLYLRQLLPLRLGAAVPSVGGWRFATIPVITRGSAPLPGEPGTVARRCRVPLKGSSGGTAAHQRGDAGAVQIAGPSAARRGSGPGLVGRVAACRLLDAQVASVAGGGSASLIIGEPGIGKMALLHRLASRSSSRTVWVSGTKTEAVLPYASAADPPTPQLPLDRPLPSRHSFARRP